MSVLLVNFTSLTEPICLVSGNRYHEDRETYEGIRLKYIFLSDSIVLRSSKVPELQKTDYGKHIYIYIYTLKV